MLGAMLGLAYESVRLLRLIAESCGKAEAGIIKKAVRGFCIAFTFVSDIVFCIVFALTAILLTYNISGGVFRGGVYLLMLAGLIIYRATLGRLIFRLDQIAAKFVSKTAALLFKLVLFPFRIIFLLFNKIYTLTIGKILCKIKSRIKKRRKKRQKEKPKEPAEALLPPCGAEKKKDAVEQQKYRKEGRISFGGRRGA